VTQRKITKIKVFPYRVVESKKNREGKSNSRRSKLTKKSKIVKSKK